MARPASARIGSAELAKALGGDPRRAIRSFLERQPSLVAPGPAARQRILQLCPQAGGIWKGRAERILDHAFDLLGSGEVELGTPIDWHVDFKTGYRFEGSLYYRRTRIPYGRADIKVPWELSRCQHLVTLGQAYRLAADERYALEFVAQVTDWIAKNPVKFGPNWACTMDVALRAANWLTAWELFHASPSLTEDFTGLFLRSLLEHGRFIRSNLEAWPGLSTNHYLANLSGLHCIAALVPEFEEARGWLAFCRAELEAQMQEQVYEDGCDFEASTCYHRLALELFFYPALLARRIGEGFSAQYERKLLKMFEVVRHLLKPGGRMPQIGDNDNGRFLAFEPPGTEVLDMSYLPPLGAAYFQAPELAAGARGGEWLPACWLFPPPALDAMLTQDQPPAEPPGSRAFPNAGWYVLRQGNDFVAVSAGPNGQNGRGGHAHNDKLSVELSLDGEELLVDPGTFVYTADPPARNRFRSTAHHNTVSIAGCEQNRWEEGPRGLFSLREDARARLLLFESRGQKHQMVAEHQGYGARGLVHRRSILLDAAARTVLILDRLDGQELAEGTAAFHLPPGLTPLAAGAACVRLGRARAEFSGHQRIWLSSYPYSRGYGALEMAWCIHVLFRGSLETRLSLA